MEKVCNTEILIQIKCNKTKRNVFSIMSRNLNVYKRKDNSFFILDGGKRKTIEKLTDGSFRLVLYKG